LRPCELQDSGRDRGRSVPWIRTRARHQLIQAALSHKYYRACINSISEGLDPFEQKNLAAK